MPTFRHGKNTRVFIDQYELSNQLKQADVTQEADTAETSAFGTTDKTYVVGLVGSNASFQGMFSGAAGEIDAVTNALVGDDTDHVFTDAMEGTPSGLAVGRKCLMMPGKVTMREIPAGISDMVGLNMNVIGDGKARSGIILHEYLTPETTTGNTATGQDNAVSSTAGGSAHLHVTANTRNGTFDCKIQHSTDNSSFTDLSPTFTQVPASNLSGQRIEIASGTTINRYVRALWTIAGSTGSVTFFVSFARY